MTDVRRSYYTTPIYYASGEPHLGHAYTTILTDVLARFDRQDGKDVLFLTGTDEHGQKIQDEARRRGMEPAELCDEMADRFKEAWTVLDISYDRFIRTTDADHKAIVTDFLQRLYDRGHVYAGDYAGWYSVSQERYFTEKEIGEDRVDPISGKPVEWVEEKNWFFRMSDFQEELIRHIEENPGWIVPESRKNEILGFLEQPLGDLSISRPKRRLTWGIDLPFDDEHVAYVWVDALINYLTASGAISVGAGAEDTSWESFNEGAWWPADLHVIGKDILTTHAVYWPTLLMGAGLPLPKQLLAHGWWVVGETKMSKSLGNVVDPLALREDFGTDAVRWYLMREMPTGADASYTPERFLTRYDELANVLGNLASRATSMIVKYRNGVIPAASDDGLAERVTGTLEEVRAAMGRHRIHEAFGAAMDLARDANGFVEERQPWAQAKSGDDEALDATLATLARVLTVLCALFQPVCPSKMATLAERLGLEAVPRLDDAVTISLAGRPVAKGDPLFPRVDHGWDVDE